MDSAIADQIERAPPGESPPERARIRTAGKFFQGGSQKWTLNGVTYGPFHPRDSDGAPYPEQEAALADLDQIRSLGFNTIRTYDPPPLAIWDACHQRGLRILTGIPWTDHMDLFDGSNRDEDARKAVVRVASEFRDHPARLGYLVGNEIGSTLVRWMGPTRIQRFVESLIDSGRNSDPEALFAYASYPTTEYISPANADFAAFNVYLEDPSPLSDYLARLQVLAGDRPLVITEFGADSLNLGCTRQAEIISMGREQCARSGTAGEILFAFTDEWFRGGKDITGWDFGLVTRDRKPKPAAPAASSIPPRPRTLTKPPKTSVIVCTRNGDETLEACLASLGELHYPDYEVIVVDDGSTDRTPDIARAAKGVRYIRQDAAGLGAARNRGAAEATGEILAYTDDDCMADPDWLAYLVPAFENGEFVAAGGPNIPPPPRNLDEACVSVAPGAPAHVLISDTEAEHIPGCNLAVTAEAFARIGGFRDSYRAAGDDVDFCWRLEADGGRIAFAPAAMVWHHRRASIRNYLRQQSGYGKAEAILISQHREKFGIVGGARWKGIVYGPRRRHIEDGIIYGGRFGFAPFQAVYPQPENAINLIATGVPWTLGILLFTALGFISPWFFAAATTMLATTVGLALKQTFSADLPQGFGGAKARLVLAALHLFQPPIRGWARYRHLVRLRAFPTGSISSLWEGLRLPRWHFPWARASGQFWSQEFVDRSAWLTALRAKLDTASQFYHLDDGWRDFDIEVHTALGGRVRVYSVSEYHADGSLTRFRLSATPPTILPLLTAATATAGVVAATIPTVGNSTPAIIAGAAAALAALTWLSARLGVARLKKWATSAARSIGLSTAD